MRVLPPVFVVGARRCAPSCRINPGVVNRAPTPIPWERDAQARRAALQRAWKALEALAVRASVHGDHRDRSIMITRIGIVITIPDMRSPAAGWETQIVPAGLTPLVGMA